MSPETAEYRPEHLPGCDARSLTVAEREICTVCNCPADRFLTPDENSLLDVPWHSDDAGRIYAQEGAEPRDGDPLIGEMDTPELAAEAVAGHNALLEARLT